MWTTTYDARIDMTERTSPPQEPAGGPMDGLPLGLGPGDRLEFWDTTQQANLLVLDSTGFGSAILLSGVITEAARRGWPVQICEPRRGELAGLADWPGVDLVASSPRTAAALLTDADRELDRRLDSVDTGGETAAQMAPRLMVVNLYDDVEAVDRELRRPTSTVLYNLALDGPAVGMHIAYGAKRSMIGHGLRDCFDVHAWTGSPPPPPPLTWTDEDDHALGDDATLLRPFWRPLPEPPPRPTAGSTSRTAQT